LDTISIGKHNPRLADIRKAIDRGELTADGLLPIEGPKLIQEAIASQIAIEALFLRQGAQFTATPRTTAVYVVEPSVFKAIQSTEHSQGVIALVRPRQWKLSEVIARAPAPITVLAGLQDPGNVGTILRVAEAFAAAGCLGLTGTASVRNPKVVRASAGSAFRVPHVWDLQWADLLDKVKPAGIRLVGTSPHATESIADWDWSLPTAILIGNEGAGLTTEQSSACAAVLRIPQHSPVESLNSAIAASVILYESYRRRSS